MTMDINAGRVTLAVGAAVAIALGIWSFLPNPLHVETATVTRGRFVATVDEDGKTRIREKYIVAAPLAGRLGRIRLKAGDGVTAEEIIATIQPAPTAFLDPRSRAQAEERLGNAEAARERARARLERARAEAAQAKTDLDRKRKLAAIGASPIQEVEHAELDANVAERDLRAAQFEEHAAGHAAEEARAVLAQYHERGVPPELWNVAAPVSGVVLKVLQESETVIQPGGPILEVGDPEDLEIAVDVLSTDAVEIRPGAEVSITNWGRLEPLSGRVRRVEPAAFTKLSVLGVEEQRVNVLIDLLSPRKDRIGLGDAYQVDVRIAVWSADDAIVVPAGALFRTGDGWNVYVVAEGRAQLRPITLDRRSGRFAALSGGLKPGEQVILYPGDKVAPGVRVDSH
jgi:HlyD family secretion protein